MRFTGLDRVYSLRLWLLSRLSHTQNYRQGCKACAATHYVAVMFIVSRRIARVLASCTRAAIDSPRLRVNLQLKGTHSCVWLPSSNVTLSHDYTRKR
jgi:hypothetical protein